MKKELLLIALTLSLAAATQATLITYSSGTLNTLIPDANPTGVRFNSASFSAIDIQDVNVSLNISGGYNGDLYGYLVTPGGARIDLINRIGQDINYPFGNSGSLINVTLDHTGSLGSIQNAPFGSVTGSYIPDYESGGNTLATLNGQNAIGTWTLFLADLSGGDTSHLVSWGLNIHVVPEPTTWALILFGMVMGLTWLFSWYRARARTN